MQLQKVICWHQNPGFSVWQPALVVRLWWVINSNEVQGNYY